jgi:hypothetical protein
MEHPEVTKLYKYRAYNESSLSLLINKKIWVSKPTAFNDPFDCKLVFNKNYSKEDYSEYLLTAGVRLNQSPEDMANRITDAYKDGVLRQEEKDELNKNFEDIQRKIFRAGVYTLSQTNSNILLWAHYADSHQGFCIEYDRAPDNILGNFDVTKPVDYSEYFPVIHLSDLRYSEDPISKVLMSKSRNWRYEKEWRLFYQNGNVEEDLPAPISSIIFGLRMPENHKKTIKNIMKNYQNVIFKQAVVVEGKYKLKIVDA